MTAFPQVPVAEASPATLAIYRQAMAAAGAGSPALFFRFSAIYPGLLDWIWSAVGPDIAAGWPSREVWKIVDDQPAVDLPAFQLDDAERRSIRDMLISYNRMNSVNFAIVGAVRGLVTGDGPPPPQAPCSEAAFTPPAPMPDLPPPRRLDQLDEGQKAAVLAICRTHRPIEIGGQRVDVPPTLYMHAALWPDYFMAATGAIDAAMDRIDAATHDLAARCAPLIGQVLANARARNPGPPPLDDATDLTNVMNAFMYLSPHMVVAGRALEMALDKA